MQSVKEAASSFLANKRVAVTGVSRTPKTHGSNNVYRRLRERGYDVFAVNPNAQEVEGDRSYPGPEIDPRRRRGGRDRHPAGDRRHDDARLCRARHQARVDAPRPRQGSVSDSATTYGRQHGITVIDGGCPLMFEPTSDFGHRLMRVVYARKVPKQV